MGVLNPRLAQQQMGLELLRRRAKIGQGAGSTGMDLVQQHQLQQAQYLAARNGHWPQHGALQGHGLHNRMMDNVGSLGLPARVPTGQGGLGAGDGDDFGTLQTEHVEIDGTLHTMFCVRSNSPPRLNLGLHGSAFDTAIGYTPFDYNPTSEIGVLGDGLADSRWMQPMSPRRAPPALAPLMNHGRSSSPLRQSKSFFSRLSPPRHMSEANYQGNSLSFQRQEGLLHQSLLAFEPRPLLNQRLLSQQSGGWVSPRREATMLTQGLLSSSNDFLPMGRDLVGPTGRDHQSQIGHYLGWQGLQRDSMRSGKRIPAIPQRTRPGEVRSGRIGDRARDRSRTQTSIKKHTLPLEQAIAAKKSKLADLSRQENEGTLDELILFEDREQTEEFQAKVEKCHVHYTKVLKEDTIRRRKYEAAKNGRARKLECLGCGRSAILALEPLHAQHFLCSLPLMTLFVMCLQQKIL